MPAVSMKQFTVLTPAGSNTPQTTISASPATPGRTLLFIQNNGANPGRLHFKENVQNDTSDIVVVAGDHVTFSQSDTTPREKINLGSALATSWVILEQVTQ